MQLLTLLGFTSVWMKSSLYLRRRERDGGTREAGGSSMQASLCCYAQEDTLPCASVSRLGVMHLSQLSSQHPCAVPNMQSPA